MKTEQQQAYDRIIEELECLEAHLDSTGKMASPLRWACVANIRGLLMVLEPDLDKETTCK